MSAESEVMVSIICTVYNHEKYLRQCLDGIVMQKTSFKFEAIVNDDVSTDGSAAIIREYAQKYPEIIKPVYQTENQYSKQDGSLWKAMYQRASGKYISYCEGDDYWINENKLQTQVDILEAHPEYTACTHNQIIVDDNSIPYPQYVQKAYRHVTDTVLDIGFLRNHNKVAHTASYLFRHSLIQNMSLEQWEEFIRVRANGDMLLAALFFINGKVYHIAKDMACYRHVRSGNDSWTAQNARKNICLSTCLMLQAVCVFMRKYYAVDIDYSGNYKRRAYEAVLIWIKNSSRSNLEIMKETCKLAGYSVFHFLFDFAKHLVRIVFVNRNK